MKIVSAKWENRVRRRIVRPFDSNVIRPVRRFLNAGKTYQPLFVSGAMGSGTSLIATLLYNRFKCAGLVNESVLSISPSSFFHVDPLNTYTSVADYSSAISQSPSWSLADGRTVVCLEGGLSYQRKPSRGPKPR